MYSCNISNKSCPLMGLSNNINNSLQSVSCLFYFLVILSSNFIRKKSKHAMWHSNRQPWTERSEKGCFFSVQCAAVKKKGKKKKQRLCEGEEGIFLGPNWNKYISSNIATPCWDKDWSHILGFGSWLMLPGHIHVGSLQFRGIWSRPRGRVSDSCCPLEVVQLQCMT